MCELSNVEAAEGLQSEHQLRFHGNCVVAADKKHPEQIVCHLSCEEGLHTVARRADAFAGVLLQNAKPAGLLAQLSHQIVVRHSKEPGRRIGRQAPHGPRLKRGHQRGLNGVLNRLDVLHAYPARQCRYQATVFVPEEVLNQLGRTQGEWISMTSTPEPGRTSPGHPRATSIASSRLWAETIM
jgi:hypothetical protein